MANSIYNPLTTTQKNPLDPLDPLKPKATNAIYNPLTANSNPQPAANTQPAQNTALNLPKFGPVVQKSQDLALQGVDSTTSNLANGLAQNQLKNPSMGLDYQRAGKQALQNYDINAAKGLDTLKQNVQTPGGEFNQQLIDSVLQNALNRSNLEASNLKSMHDLQSQDIMNALTGAGTAQSMANSNFNTNMSGLNNAAGMANQATQTDETIAAERYNQLLESGDPDAANKYLQNYLAGQTAQASGQGVTINPMSQIEKDAQQTAADKAKWASTHTSRPDLVNPDGTLTPEGIQTFENEQNIATGSAKSDRQIISDIVNKFQDIANFSSQPSKITHGQGDILSDPSSPFFITENDRVGINADKAKTLDSGSLSAALAEVDKFDETDSRKSEMKNTINAEISRRNALKTQIENSGISDAQLAVIKKQYPLLWS